MKTPLTEAQGRRLAKICREHSNHVLLRDGLRQVVEEPYLPYVPPDWNGILVLAESQNLADDESEYVNWLHGLDPEKSFLRLYLNSPLEGLGVAPWDDGILRIGAVVAKPGKSPAEMAVSNAIPWSFAEGRVNARAFSAPVRKMAAGFWSEVLHELRPEHIIAAGAVAKDVLRRAGWDAEQMTCVRLPSPRLASWSGMFDPDDLLRRYAEVDEILQSPVGRQIVADSDICMEYAVFYCSHVASLASKAQPSGMSEAIRTRSRRVT